MKKPSFVTALRIIATAVCAAVASCAVFASADSGTDGTTFTNDSNIASATAQTNFYNSGNNNLTNPVKTSSQIGPQEETSQPQVGPQATCRATNWANWGTPYSGATGVSGQDSSTVQWQITSDCVLHLTGGTSPDISNRQGNIPWNSRRGSIVGVKVEGNLTLFKSDIDLNPMFTNMYNLTSVDTTGGSLHLAESAAAGLFDSCTSLTTINGITSWDTSQTTGMASMFYFCTGLSQLDLSGFNTANVEDMSNMFDADNALTSIKFSSNFKTGNVTSMSDMFNGCSLLPSLDLSKFDTRAVKSMAHMFAGCSSLTDLNLSNFDTGNVNNMNAMFQSCNKLASLDLSSFVTTKVTDMSYMFNDCSSLTSWVQPNFATSLVTDMAYMFDGCTNLTTLDISSFDTTKAMSSMTQLLPNGLRRLKLGTNTQLSNTAFSNVDSTINWEEMSSLDNNATHIGSVGNLSALQTRAASSNPAGSYWDSRLTPTGVQLAINANGGVTNFTPVSYDTTTAAATITVPQGNVLTANMSQYVFTGWNSCASPVSSTSCKPYQPGDTIAVAQGDSNPVRTLTLYAQWAKVPWPVIDNNTPMVHAPLGASPTADITVTNTPNTNSFVASAMASSVTTITTPLGFHATENGIGTFTESGVPIAQVQPVMGRSYTINVLTTMTDPLTGNTVTARPVSKNGMIPYYNITFDANGGTGAPTDMSGFADVDNHYRTTAPIPADVIPTKGEHDMFAGWSTSPTATQPDYAYNPGTYAPTFWQYDSSHQSAKTQTLYAVWHEAKAPVISEVHRDPTSHHVIATGTAQPWNAIGSPTVTGHANTGLQVNMATLAADGTLSIAGIASGIKTSVGGHVVTVRIRACSANIPGQNGTAPPAKIGWSNDNNDIPAGCTQVFGPPSSFIQVPMYPIWLGGLNNEWSASLNVTGKPYIWVYAQTQDGPIDGPLMITPIVQGSDNSVKTCVKTANTDSSNYVCGTATMDNTATFDGTTTHSWSLDLPESTAFDSANAYDTSSHLYIDDTWRNNASGGGGGGSRLSVISPEAYLGGAPPSTNALPFTGGLFRRIMIALAALIGSAAILLTAFVTFRRRILQRNR
ncbi:BspA family leucine-rich repeat surface protein [Bifidobacterium sp. ESL0690]|uniref:BspA family leucine-rich repeat surface protein n=1 Tax=Bifidobacterium sp. ESL0690 TaxID=2983214 RepID=UPI0023F86512|nr:BspA family leucine-rich repeat surface protein [Bifidobacterium sp. ESL0690]WEV46665.1 BspA family leucine-rich repeat surface protein [Bifidobacterium sp. ESL0690]